MKQSERNYKRIVIKIGSSLFYKGGELNDSRLFDIVSQIASLVVNEKKEVIIVSSGAIALGMEIMKLQMRPKELRVLQAAAAIGQNALMQKYSEEFSKYKNSKVNCAQILLTWDDFDNRERYLNAKNTLLTLLKLGTVPIINENDTVSTEEIKFGDNDRLSALVASLICADLLIILSDVDGLLDKNKHLVRVVDEINSQIKSLACPTDKRACVGGMITKLEAARIAIDSGIPCVIANGRKEGVIGLLALGSRSVGTLFMPKKGLDAKQRWIAFGTKPKGRIIIDKGAGIALADKKSLLSVGVVALEGSFEAGDVVSVVSGGVEIARGKAGISSKQLDKVKGARCSKEVIHRDNIVILQ